MAIQVADNFQYLGQKPLDARVKYATVADMAAVAASSLYDGIMAYVVATEKNYQWKSTNTVDPTLGKWREFESGGGSGSDNVVEGYRNPTNGLFYEEAAYTTAITGAANTLYVDLVTVGDAKDIYRWDGTDFVLENTRSQDIAYNDYQALSESEKNNGTTYYIPDAIAASEMLVVGNRFDKANIYTETEKMIGSWNGKPLYQKTINFGALPNNTSKFVDHNISNLSQIIDSKTMVYTGTSWFTLSYISPDNLASAVYCSVTSTQIKIETGADRSNWTAYVTLQYTKTTDGTIKIGTENDYSTDEMIVGSWIDGKPLYQRTLVKTGGVANNALYFQNELSGVDVLIKKDVLFRTDLYNGSWESEYSNSVSDKLQVIASKTGTSGNYVYTTFASRSVTEMYVTVLYTKTTD